MRNLRLISNAFFTFLVLVFVFFVHADCFSQSNDYAYQIPKKLNDGWDVSSLSDEDIDKQAIEEISREIADIDRYENVLSMLIVKNGTSTLIGIAVDKEFIASVETKLHELLPQFPDDFKDPEKRKISLKHVCPPICRKILAPPDGVSMYRRDRWRSGITNPGYCQIRVVIPERWKMEGKTDRSRKMGETSAENIFGDSGVNTLIERTFKAVIQR